MVHLWTLTKLGAGVQCLSASSAQSAHRLQSAHPPQSAYPQHGQPIPRNQRIPHSQRTLSAVSASPAVSAPPQSALLRSQSISHSQLRPAQSAPRGRCSDQLCAERKPKLRQRKQPGRVLPAGKVGSWDLKPWLFPSRASTSLLLLTLSFK